jgi:hypothetical protein
VSQVYISLYYPTNTDVVLYRLELLHTCESIPSKTTVKISGHSKTVLKRSKTKTEKDLEILATVKKIIVWLL